MTDDLLPIAFPSSGKDRTKNLARGMAARLRDHIENMGWTVHGQARWQEAFKLLLNEHSEKEVNDRLTAYINLRINRPRVHNGDDFRNMWDWIGEQIELRQRPELIISDTAMQIVATLVADLTWPVQAIERLPVAVEQSLQTVTRFADMLRTALADKPDRDLRDAISIILAELMDPPTYLKWWFAFVHRKYSKWADWTGNLTGKDWCPTRDKAVRGMRTAIIQYVGHDDGTWDRILKLWAAHNGKGQT